MPVLRPGDDPTGNDSSCESEPQHELTPRDSESSEKDAALNIITQTLPEHLDRGQDSDSNSETEVVQLVIESKDVQDL